MIQSLFWLKVPRLSRTLRWFVLASLAVALCLVLVRQGLVINSTAQDENYSVLFNGHGVNDIDRIKIPIDPAVPADIGAGSFTVEWWMRAFPGENHGSVVCNQSDGWITGNILIDRDIYGSGDYGDFGISLNDGKVAFGINDESTGITICTQSSVDDGLWHHIAVTRDSENGQVVIFVDGQIDGQGIGPTGDVSYRDGRSSDYPHDPYLVLGAEKHDEGPAYPSYTGLIDEIRLSTVIRYTKNFTRPTVAFTPDAGTVALYHLDEGPAGACTGTILDASQAVGGPSPGICRYGGATPSGPVYVADTPFTPVVFSEFIFVALLRK